MKATGEFSLSGEVTPFDCGFNADNVSKRREHFNP